MSMIPLQDFFLHVYPDVIGCPEVYVKDAIISSIVEFTDKSLAWQEVYICADIEEGESKYALNITGDLTIAQPLTVIIDNCSDPDDTVYKVLSKQNSQDLDSYQPKWRSILSEVPDRYVMEMPNVIRLVGIPTKSMPNSLHIRVAAKPSRTATSVPEFLMTEWLDTIIAGSLYRLHSMSGKSWARPEMVNYYYRKFREGISRAKSKFYKNSAYQSKTFLPPRYSPFYF